MTLSTLFEQQLAAFTSTGAGVVAASAPPRHIRCEVAEARPLAISINELLLTSDELASAKVDDLQAISKDLAGRLTYLLEPIGPIEIDQDQCIVQLRSLPPAKNNSGHTYYELLVRRGGYLSLRRYEKTQGDARQTIPTTLTREVLERLVDDLSGALDRLILTRPVDAAKK